MGNERDPLTGLTEEELRHAAEEAYAVRDDPTAWEEVQAEVAPQVRSVVSVRFGPEELAAVERAATEAGLAISTYIRNAALSDASAFDVDTMRRLARELLRDAEQVNRLLGTEPAA